jgi:hypothetical protein
MLTTWALTIPATMALSAMRVWLFTEMGKMSWLVGWFLNWLTSS